jgi:hypothetical protein
MPTSEEILSVLKQISNDLILLAIVFHILIFVIAIALIKGWRPTKYMAGLVLSIPLLSVSVIAWIYNNPFNGVLFGIFFILLFLFSLKLPKQPIGIATGSWKIPAVLLIAFGIFYPHFLDAHPAMYLIAAPIGLIPCPTLSMVIGFTLLFRSFNSTRWAWALVTIGLFYGIFGAVKLHVYIDVILILGSLILMMYIFSLRNTGTAD